MTKDITKYTYPRFPEFPRFPSLVETGFIDSLWDHFFSDSTFGEKAFSSPTPSDVVVLKDENGEETGMELSYAVAGYDKDQINVECDTDSRTLTIAASAKAEIKDPSRDYVKRGLKKSAWRVQLCLGDQVDTDNIGASIENGVLKVTVPFRKVLEAEHQVKKIEVKASE